jgi:hypothetical protein
METYVYKMKKPLNQFFPSAASQRPEELLFRRVTTFNRKNKLSDHQGRVLTDKMQVSERLLRLARRQEG